MPVNNGQWKDYEHTVYTLLRRIYPAANIKYNVRVRGKTTGKLRQIDISVEETVVGVPVRIAFDCKRYNKKVDVKDVESMIGMLEDLDYLQGVLITNVGYTEAALKRAQSSIHRAEKAMELDRAAGRNGGLKTKALALIESANHKAAEARALATPGEVVEATPAPEIMPTLGEAPAVPESRHKSARVAAAAPAAAAPEAQIPVPQIRASQSRAPRHKPAASATPRLGERDVLPTYNN